MSVATDTAMFAFVNQNWKYLLGAMLLHGLFAGLFALTVISLPKDAPPPQLAIQATIVDPTLTASANRQRERERELERERQKAEAEQRRQKEEAERQEAERQETERKAAEQRAEQERQEQQKQQELEKQRLAERQEAERKRAAEVEEQRKEAERKRVAEIERKQKEEAERRRQAEEARAAAARESELRRQIAEEEGRMQAENAGLLNQYIALIEQRVVRNWNRPPSARSGLECEVKVAQAPGGAVLSVQVGKCNGDEAVKQSIEAAVMRSSPLPPPPDPRLFERNLLLVFRPAD